jgi:hypothetical protein
LFQGFQQPRRWNVWTWDIFLTDDDTGGDEKAGSGQLAALHGLPLDPQKASGDMRAAAIAHVEACGCGMGRREPPHLHRYYNPFPGALSNLK